jgi:hypothetical protein
VSNDNADVLGMPFAEGAWRLDTGFGIVVTPFDHVQRGGKRGESIRDVVLLTQTPSARVWLPSATYVEVTVPFTAVFTTDQDTFGIGDVTAQVGQQLSLGPGVLTVNVGGSAPTGLASNKAGVEVLLLETEDGELYASSLQTWTQPGLGVWSVSAGVGVAQPAGRWTLRAGLQTRVPLGHTDQDVRWGTDVAASSSVSTDVGPLMGAVGVQAWTHTPDVMLPDPNAEEGITYRMNRSHGIAISPSVSVSLTQGMRCGGSVQLPVWQWVGGSQLAPSYRVSAQCQMSWGKAKQEVIDNSP